MEDELDRKLKAVLSEHDSTKCHECERILDRGDCSWNTGQTEYGTPHSTLNIQCLRCDTEIKTLWTWYAVESFEEFVEQLDCEW